MAFRSLLIPLLFASLFLSCVFANDDYGENELEDISYFFESTLTLRDFPKSKNGYYSNLKYLTAKPFDDRTEEPLDDRTEEPLDNRNARLHFFMEKSNFNIIRPYQITAQYSGESEQIQLYLCAKRNKRTFKPSPKNQKYLLVGSTGSISTNKHCFLFAKLETINNNHYVSYNAKDDYNKEYKEKGKGKLVQYFRVETKTKYIVFLAVKEGEEGQLQPNPIQRLPPPPRVLEENAFFRQSYYVKLAKRLRVSSSYPLYEITRKGTGHPMKLYLYKRSGGVLYKMVGHYNEHSLPSSSYGTSEPQKMYYSQVYICRLKAENELRYILVTPIHGHINKDRRYPSDCFRLGKRKNDDMNRFVKYSDYQTEQDIPVEEYQMIDPETEDTDEPFYFSLLHRGESSQAARPVQTQYRRNRLPSVIGLNMDNLENEEYRSFSNDDEE